MVRSKGSCAARVLDSPVRHAVDPHVWRASSHRSLSACWLVGRVRRPPHRGQTPPQPRSWWWRRRPRRRSRQRQPQRSHGFTPSRQPQPPNAARSPVASASPTAVSVTADEPQSTPTPQAPPPPPTPEPTVPFPGTPAAGSATPAAGGIRAVTLPAETDDLPGVEQRVTLLLLGIDQRRLVRGQHRRHHAGQPGPRERLGLCALDSARPLPGGLRYALLADKRDLQARGHGGAASQPCTTSPACRSTTSCS